MKPVSKEDRKWLDALRPYVGGGMIPFFRLEDGAVDAGKTIDNLMRMKGSKKIDPNGEERE